MGKTGVQGEGHPSPFGFSLLLDLIVWDEAGPFFYPSPERPINVSGDENVLNRQKLARWQGVLFTGGHS